MNTKCICENWADIDYQHRILTGHNEMCTRSPKKEDKLSELISNLTKGIEEWGSYEDGIPDCIWEDYRKAKVLEGIIIVDQDD